MPTNPNILLLMGVSGCGKTSVGQALAARLGWPFRDADDDHSPENVEKMRGGEPLTEADREPWFGVLNDRLRRWAADGQSGILACSALTHHARQRITQGVPRDMLHIIWLTGPRDLIRHRIAARQGHYMPATLLDSQWDALEQPRDALEVSVAGDVPRIVDEIVAALAL